MHGTLVLTANSRRSTSKSADFQKCPYEHVLYMKQSKKYDVLFVSLYVDDLIFSENNSSMVEEFKESMVREFEMINMGLMSYYLCIEVSLSDECIFICEKKYAHEILEKFKMENSKLVDTPVETGKKLSKKG